jgi:hypothetical protein
LVTPPLEEHPFFPLEEPLLGELLRFFLPRRDFYVSFTLFLVEPLPTPYAPRFS